MATYQAPRIPEWPGQWQLASFNCIRTSKNPGQLQPGDVLVMGAGNSGADIALDVAKSHRTWLSGRDRHVPFGSTALSRGSFFPASSAWCSTGF
jgi:putative flavoprotein involved in K+ transport